MSFSFSLSDQDIIQIIEEAQSTENPNVIRDHLWRVIHLRKEVISQLGIEMSARMDLASVASSVSDVLGRETSRLITQVLDRKGNIESMRKELKKQIDGNLELANTLYETRLQLADARKQQPSVAESAELEEQRRELEALRIALGRSNQLMQDERERADLYQGRLEQSTVLIEELETKLVGAQEKAAQSGAELERVRAQLAGGGYVAPGAGSVDDVPDIFGAGQADAVDVGLLKSEVSRLTAEMREAGAESQRITMLLDEAQERVKVLEEIIREDSSALPAGSMADEAAAVSNLRQRLAEASTAKIELDQTVTDQERTITRQRSRIQALETELYSLKEKADQFERDASRLAGELETAQEETSTMRSRQDSLRNEAVRLNFLLSEKEAEVEQMARRVEASDAGLLEAQGIIADLKGREQAARGEAARLELVLQEKTVETQALAQRVAAIQSQLADSETALGRVAAAEHSLRSELDTTKADLAKRDAEISLQSEQANQLRVSNRQLQSEKATLANEVVDLKDQVQDMGKEISAQRADLVQADSLLSSSMKSLERSSTEQERLRSRIEVLTQAVRDASKARSYHYNLNARVTLELKMAQDALAQLQATNLSLAGENEALKTRVPLDQKVVPFAAVSAVPRSESTLETDSGFSSGRSL